MELDQHRPFLECQSAAAIEADAISIIGICYDGSTSFRPGARFGPNAIRDASDGIESYSPYLHRDLTDYPIHDLGNLPFRPNRLLESFEDFQTLLGAINLKQSRAKILTLGGEHSISYAPLKKYLHDFSDLVVIHLDAHADLRDGYLGDPHSHASILYRTLELFGPNHQLIQYGIRSGTRAEFELMEKNRTLKKSRNSFLESVEQLSASTPIYLTLDLDYFDPAFVPGTGTPEAGGEDFHSFVGLTKILQNKNFVGADLVELAPRIDPTDNSSCFASKVVRELLLSLV